METVNFSKYCTVVYSGTYILSTIWLPIHSPVKLYQSIEKLSNKSINSFIASIGNKFCVNITN